MSKLQFRFVVPDTTTTLHPVLQVRVSHQENVPQFGDVVCQSPWMSIPLVVIPTDEFKLACAEIHVKSGAKP